MSQPQPLVLYDIPYTVSGKACSPNPWKARLALTMKGIPHKTIWVEYPDIATVCKEIGVKSTTTPAAIASGAPQYTLPVLQDHNTGALISDSFNIALYLDKTYPHTIRLIPEGTDAFQAMCVDVFVEKMLLPLALIYAVEASESLSPRSTEYFRRTREAAFGKRLEELSPEGPVRDAHWKQCLDGLTVVQGWTNENRNGGESLYIMGDTPSFADVVIVSILICIKALAGAESDGWRVLMEANRGHWARLVAAFDQWIWVDEESTKP
ncbi:hypothetical protein EVG20_g1914 [Dentipellis fragilis]|uniref:GST N-terminal domain-containing protein n=1 Tax=Dentipellis fragilis TaxID=205917 RepID=A0A4Y9ZCG0_9AGAM|nr:hypothetical protein EVG20_g1914 [Dentipellis fragilis]